MIFNRSVLRNDNNSLELCRIMIATLSFLLDYEKIEDGEDDSDYGSEDDVPTQSPQVVLSKELVYKVGEGIK